MGQVEATDGRLCGLQKDGEVAAVRCRWAEMLSGEDGRGTEESVDRVSAGTRLYSFLA